MSKKKSAGIDPHGHAPFSKVKLESTKRHHDNHGKDASVPAKGNKPATPNQHWEKQYKEPEGNQKKSGIRAFDPIKGKNRPHTHEKVNETDH